MTENYIIKNTRLVLPNRVTDTSGWIQVENGIITALGENNAPNHITSIDAKGSYLFPGLVDLQINGGGGINFNDCKTQADVDKIAAANLSTGTTNLCATLITDTIEVLVEKIALLANSKNDMIAGIHVEGPFFNDLKRGMHAPEKIIAPSIEDAQKLVEAGKGKIKIITLAPEIPGALEVITYLKDQGIIVSMAHSNATYQETIKGIEAGASMGTHLFNTMPQIHHRASGMPTALLNRKAYVGLIADGEHLDEGTLQLVFDNNGSKPFLVSDAIAPLGTRNESFDYHGKKIKCDHGACRDENGTLAGSITPLLNGVVHVHKNLGLSLYYAANVASMVPAQILKRDDIGCIATGKKADFLLVSKDFKLEQVYKNGQAAPQVFNL